MGINTNILIGLFYSYKCLFSHVPSVRLHFPSTISSVQQLSCVQLFAASQIAAHQASLSITKSQTLLKLMSMGLVMPSNLLIFCHTLFLLPSIFPSIRVFSNESVLRIRWPKYWSFSISISPSSEYSGLISFSFDCFDLLAVQGTLKSLLKHHSLKASILQHSAFFMVQLSHPYMITGKDVALTIWPFIGKVMSLLFNMLSRFVKKNEQRFIYLFMYFDAQAGFRKGRGTRDQIANICWIIKKAREFQKNIYFCFIDYAKAFDCVDHNKLWEILKEMGIPDHPICLLRNLYAGQEATVQNWTWNNRLVPNRKRSMSRLYIVTLLI